MRKDHAGALLLKKQKRPQHQLSAEALIYMARRGRFELPTF